jgi:hypothetical protein
MLFSNTVATETANKPKRVVLRFSTEYERHEAAINEAFIARYGPKPINDFYSHLMAPNESSKMHIILDLYCNRNSAPDLQKIEYQVFRVRKRDNLYVVGRYPAIISK